MTRTTPRPGSRWRPRWLTGLVVVLGAVALLLETGDHQQPRSAEPLDPSALVSTTSESGLRAAVRLKVAPVYPPRSLAQGTEGVVVVEVVVGTNSKAESVRVLEAPDAEMGAAVRAALPLWEFFPVVEDGSMVGQTRVRLRGKLTFYFRIHGGAGQVLDPAEMARLRAGHS
jgi:TonB family protein